jgi:two-component SAPR family response regulator
MKKVLSIILTLVILVSTYSTTVFAQETDYGKFIDSIEATNQKIDLQIEMAIDQADNLIVKYEDALLKNMQYMNAEDFEYYLRTVENTLSMLSDSGSQSERVANKLSALYAKIDMIQNKIDSNPNIENRLIIKDEKAVEQAQILTAEFEKDLNSIITNTFK